MDSNELCNLWDILGRIWQGGERGGQDVTNTSVERFVPESAPRNVVWTHLLKLLAEAVPKPSVVELCTGENTEYPNNWRSWKSR